MSTGIRTVEEHIEEAMRAADIAWWEMEYPSGALNFSENKTRMLGYEKRNFYHYTKFTELIHPDDYDAAMDAMMQLMKGNKETYETKYRIKAADGSYKLFYDKGKIVERNDSGFIIAGMVIDITGITILLRKRS